MGAPPMPARTASPETGPFVLRHHVWALVYCGFFAIGAFLFGYDMSYFGGVVAMNPFIEKFGDNVDDAGVRSFSAPLLAILTSIIQVGDLIGALSSGVIGFYLGRKGGLFVASFLCCVAIILQAAAQNPATFIAGRIVLGLAVGILSSAVPLYLSDVAPKEIRGMVVGSWQLILAIAGVVGAGICQGTEGLAGQVSYLVPICFQLICPVAIMSFIWFVPESPRYLFSKDRVDEARAALIKVNRNDPHYDPSLELAEYQLQQEAEAASQGGSWLELLTDPVERRKTLLCAGIFMAQQFTGMTFIATYCTVFAQDLQVADPFAINMVENVLSVVGVVVGWAYIERLNRRTILLSATSFMVVVMLIIGGLACGPQKEPLVPVETLGKAIIGLTMIYVLCFNMSWGPLAWTVATEMCPGRNRPRIMAVSVMVFWICSWLVTFTLPYLFTTARLGAKIGFVYAGSATVSLSFVYFFLPESSGRVLEEIEEMFSDRIPAHKWSRHQTRLLQEALDSTKLQGVDPTDGATTVSVSGNTKGTGEKA